jgi:hypothetical protein
MRLDAAANTLAPALAELRSMGLSEDGTMPLTITWRNAATSFSGQMMSYNFSR